LTGLRVANGVNLLLSKFERPFEPVRDLGAIIPAAVSRSIS